MEETGLSFPIIERFMTEEALARRENHWFNNKDNR